MLEDNQNREEEREVNLASSDYLEESIELVERQQILPLGGKSKDQPSAQPDLTRKGLNPSIPMIF